MPNNNAPYQRTITDIHGEHTFDVREIENMSTVVRINEDRYVFKIYMTGQLSASMWYTDSNTAELQRFALYNLWKGWEAEKNAKSANGGTD